MAKDDDILRKPPTQQVNLDDLVDDDNVGMKKPSGKNHKNLSQEVNTDEVDTRRRFFERQEKRKKLGITLNILEKKRQEEEEETQIISQDFVEQNSRSNKAERFNPALDFGLSDSQVNQRIKENLVNDNQKQYTKTYKSIFFSNIFTFFNILCIGVAIALIIVEEYKNLSFLIILLVNTIIGIVQECKAKQTIERLSIVTAPTATIIRNSLTREVQVKELVLDDIVLFKTGKQIPADCIILQGDVEINESLLTGESIPIKKGVGSNLYAGSFVVAGNCVAKVNRVGQDCYIQCLQARAKRYSKPKSELLRSLRLITTFITIVIVPLGTIMGWRNYSSASASVYSPTYGTSGTVALYGVNSYNNSETFITKLTDYGSITELEDSAITIDTSTIADLPTFNQIKISYDDKASGNLSISSIRLYYAEEKIDETDPSITLYVYPESPNDIWLFNDTEETDVVSKSSGVDTYLDGTLKLDESGDYFYLAFKNLDKATTANFKIRITLQSRGYGYDKTEAEELVVKEQILKLTITKTAGSLVGMIPAGLFLLVTIALASSVVRLSKSKTLVQELYCIEMLARVDCICFDKTGTLTDGAMEVKEIIDISSSSDDPPLDTIMGSFIGAVGDNNMTSIALQDRFGVNFELIKIASVPFNSTRKMSAVTFDKYGTYVLGAPEFVYHGKSEKILTTVAKKAARGFRVLMLAKSDNPIVDGTIPTNATPVALIILEDHVRPEAKKTIEWFNENGVDIKVISGDSPATVAEIANKVGINGAGDYISLEGLSPQEVENAANNYTVFGRVSPDQKSILIRALKKKGKTVAMTGDGVNDILAMKDADCSIAMANGSDAARNVAHLVLLDSNFANMPKVVMEGRRVINNIQSSASLYLMKTLFVMTITLICLFATDLFKTGYPFEPIQFLLLESLIIGIPSIVLALQPNTNKIKGSFFANIIESCVTQAICLVVSVVAIYYFSLKGIKGLDLSNATEVNSISVIAITYVGLIILTNICRPFNTLRSIVCIGVFIIITTVFTVPFLANYIGVSYTFNDLEITKQLFVLVVILALFPISRLFDDVIRNKKEKIKKEN